MDRSFQRTRPSRLHGGISVAPAFLLLFCAACSGNGPTGGGTVDDLPALSLTEVQRIGSLDDPDVGFSRIAGVGVGPEANVFVLDAGDRDIRVYAPDGTLLRTIGRPGQGPGEFQNVPMFGVVGDTVWAFQNFSRRLSLFDRQGNLLSDNPVDGVRVALAGKMDGVLFPALMRPDGRLVGRMLLWVARKTPASIAQGDTVQVPFVLFDGRGRPVDTVGWYPDPQTGSTPPETITAEARQFVVPPPPSPDPDVIATTDGRILVDRPLAQNADTGSFSVTRVLFSGDTIYHRSYRYRPVGYPEAVLDSLATMYVRRGGGMVYIVNGVRQEAAPPSDVSGIARKIRDAMHFPDVQPPIQRSFLGADGSLWLRREDDGGALYRWLVLGPDGVARGNVDLSRNTSPSWARGNDVWLTEQDPLGVPWLVHDRIGTGS